MKTATTRSSLGRCPALVPAWSPDGRYLAFHREGGIYVIDMATRQQHQLTSGSSYDAYPDWTADGRYVLFSRSYDLYRIPPDGAPGDEELVAAGWGFQADCWSTGGIARVLIGPSGSDWGGTNPPFGLSRYAVIVAYGADGVQGAVSFSLLDTEAPVTLRDRTPHGSSDSHVICEARAQHIPRVFIDNGPGVPRTTVILTDTGVKPTAVLVAFNSQTGEVMSIIPLVDQPVTQGLGGRLRVERAGGEIVISGVPMLVYDAGGRLVSGSRPVYSVRLDGRTGRPLLQE